MILSGPLTIRQISEKEWHLCIELDTSDMKLWNQMPDMLKKLFRWPGHDVIHCSITFGGEFHDLSESKKSFFVQATQKFPFVSLLVTNAETGEKYSYNKKEKKVIRHGQHWCGLNLYLQKLKSSLRSK